jgi:hypothetical protein
MPAQSRVQYIKQKSKSWIVRFVRLLFEPGNYTNNLAKIGLRTLQKQRRRDDLVLVHTIYHQKLPIVHYSSQTTLIAHKAPESLSPEVQQANIATPKTNINKRSHYFEVRSIEWWNVIPLNIRECSHGNVFF